MAKKDAKIPLWSLCIVYVYFCMLLRSARTGLHMQSKVRVCPLWHASNHGRPRLQGAFPLKMGWWCQYIPITSAEDVKKFELNRRTLPNSLGFHTFHTFTTFHEIVSYWSPRGLDFQIPDAPTLGGWKPCFPVDFPKRSSPWNFHKIKTYSSIFFWRINTPIIIHTFFLNKKVIP
jgi:hypothetical protein